MDQVDAGRLDRLQEAAGQADGHAVALPDLRTLAWLEADHARFHQRLAGDYGDYCLELKAAQENRFAHLPRNGMNYAYQMDASRYARFLRTLSEHHGAKRIE
ncbi:MAG TPA: tryptophan 7-halogenase, partial [Ramlibacter sp.]